MKNLPLRNYIRTHQGVFKYPIYLQLQSLIPNILAPPLRCSSLGGSLLIILVTLHLALYLIALNSSQPRDFCQRWLRLLFCSINFKVTQSSTRASQQHISWIYKYVA